MPHADLITRRTDKNLMGRLSLGRQLPEATRMERGLCSSPLLLLVDLFHVTSHSEDMLLNALFLIWSCLPSSTQQGCREGTVRKAKFYVGNNCLAPHLWGEHGPGKLQPTSILKGALPACLLAKEISLQTHLGTSSREEKNAQNLLPFFFPPWHIPRRIQRSNK